MDGVGTVESHCAGNSRRRERALPTTELHCVGSQPRQFKNWLSHQDTFSLRCQHLENRKSFMIPKTMARSQARERRLSWTDTQVQELSKQIVSQISSEWLGWPRHHLFWPIPAQKEVQTSALAHQIVNESALYLPKVSGPGQLTHHRWYPGDTLLPSGLGIPEPTNVGESSAQFWENPCPTLVWVPLLAFDPAGYRVGYGKGFYDQFLGEAPQALKVGLSLSGPLSDYLEHDPWDVRLDACVTPEGIWTF